MKTRLGPFAFFAAYCGVWVVAGAAVTEVYVARSTSNTGLEGLVVLFPAIGLLQVPFSAWLTYRWRRLGFVLRAGLATSAGYLASIGLMAIFLLRVSVGGVDWGTLAGPIWPLLIPAAACGLLIAGFGLQTKKPRSVGSGADPDQ